MIIVLFIGVVIRPVTLNIVKAIFVRDFIVIWLFRQKVATVF